jgi:hypothetical protein
VKCVSFCMMGTSRKRCQETRNVKVLSGGKVEEATEI